MSMGYTKLFNSILHSTIWGESHETRIVWITLLAMCDKNGIVTAALPGIAHAAHVTVRQAEDALKTFQSPDPYSRTPEFEGRRIEPVSGGWVLLNHAKYRDMMSLEERREYNRKNQASFRERKKRGSASMTVNDTSITFADSNQKSAMSAHTDTDTDTDTESKTTTTAQTAAPAPKKPSTAKATAPEAEYPGDLDNEKFKASWAMWEEHRRQKKLSPYKPLGKSLQFKQFAEWGSDRAIAAIEFSIGQMYNGIYEKKSNGQPLRQTQQGNSTAYHNPGYADEIEAVMSANAAKRAAEAVSNGNGSGQDEDFEATD